jgi:hypothetical protein
MQGRLFRSTEKTLSVFDGQGIGDARQIASTSSGQALRSA